MAKQKLFTKSIDDMLFAQYRFNSNFEKQKVACKIFNPYGDGTWYILNSDPDDPDYLWAIVSMFGNVEVGSVSRSELENISFFGMNIGLERDISFEPISALEVYEGLLAGKHYANGGEITLFDDFMRAFREDYDDMDNYLASFSSLEEAKQFAINNKNKYGVIVFLDAYGDSIYVDKNDTKEDIDFLFSTEFAKGGKTKKKKYKVDIISSGIQKVIESKTFTNKEDAIDYSYRADGINDDSWYFNIFGLDADGKKIIKVYGYNEYDEDKDIELDEYYVKSLPKYKNCTAWQVDMVHADYPKNKVIYSQTYDKFSKADRLASSIGNELLYATINNVYYEDSEDIAKLSKGGEITPKVNAEIVKRAEIIYADNNGSTKEDFDVAYAQAITESGYDVKEYISIMDKIGIEHDVDTEDFYAKGGGIESELKEALRIAEGSVFSQDFTDKYEIVKNVYSDKKYENPSEIAKNRKKELQNEGYAVKIKKVNFSDLARGEAFFLTAIKRKYAKGGEMGNFDWEALSYNQKLSLVRESGLMDSVALKSVGTITPAEMSKLKNSVRLNRELQTGKFEYGGELDMTKYNGAGMFAYGGEINKDDMIDEPYRVVVSDKVADKLESYLDKYNINYEFVHNTNVGGLNVSVYDIMPNSEISHRYFDAILSRFMYGFEGIYPSISDYTYEDEYAKGGRITTNDEIIEAFLRSEKRASVNNLYIYPKDNEMVLVNYDTIIARRMGNKVYVTTRKYSVTTSQIQSKIRSTAMRLGLDLIEVDDITTLSPPKLPEPRKKGERKAATPKPQSSFFSEFAKGGKTKKSKDNQYMKDVDAYKWFVVNLKSNKAESGWEHKSDAIEALSNYEGDDNYKVVSERGLKLHGISNPKDKWKSYANGGRVYGAGIFKEGGVNDGHDVDLEATKQLILNMPKKDILTFVQTVSSDVQTQDQAIAWVNSMTQDIANNIWIKLYLVHKYNPNYGFYEDGGELNFNEDVNGGVVVYAGGSRIDRKGLESIFSKFPIAYKRIDVIRVPNLSKEEVEIIAAFLQQSGGFYGGIEEQPIRVSDDEVKESVYTINLSATIGKNYTPQEVLNATMAVLSMFSNEIGKVSFYIIKYLSAFHANNLQNALKPYNLFIDTRIQLPQNWYKFEKGGKIGFKALSKKVAERYAGKKVPSKYQSEYGKSYSKEEAREVGNKVAAKVYRQQLAKRK